MTTPAEVYALTGAIVACWIIFIVRLLSTLQKQIPGHYGTETIHVFKWSLWLVVLFVILAGTANHPIAIDFFEHSAGRWFGTIPRTIFAVLTYIIGGHVCLAFLPTYKLFRWNWPLFAGLLTIGTYCLVLILVTEYPSSFPFSLDIYRGALADSFLYLFILVSTLHIVLPALNWLRHREKHATMRLRLLSLTGMYLLIVVWMANNIALQLALVLGLPYELHILIYPLANAGVAFLFILSFLAPSDLYRWLARPIGYLVSLVTFVYLRRVEDMACAWTHHDASNPTTLDILRAPGRAVYMSAINILDARKILKVHPDPAARDLAARLDLAAQSDLELSDVLMRLRRVGRDYLIRKNANVAVI
jgi:hypothetical protein